MSIACGVLATVIAAVVLLYVTVALILVGTGVTTWITAKDELQAEMGKEAIRWSLVWPFRLHRQIFGDTNERRDTAPADASDGSTEVAEEEQG